MAREIATRSTEAEASVRDASPRAVARYLASLKPVLGSATDARGVWVRYMNELAAQEDLAAAHTDAVQMALARAQQFYDARRQLGLIPVPSGFSGMHRAVDGWLQAMLSSCETIVRAPPPLQRAALTQARELLREAATRADRFNTERAAAVMAIQEAQSAPTNRPKMVASRKELRVLIIAVVAILLVVGGGGFAASQLLSTAPAGPSVDAPAERLTFTRAQVLDRLRQEVAARRLAFQDPDVELVVPNLVIISGRVQGPTSLIPVQATIEVSVTEDGAPRINARGITAAGIAVPPEVVAALNQRADQFNRELPQLLGGVRLSRVFVESPELVVVEFAPGAVPPPAPPPGGLQAPAPGAPAPAAPAPAAPAPAKP